MRNSYVLQDLQVAIMHGPGRRPASEQLFLTFTGPGDVLFSFVAEGAMADATPRPRQFPAGPAGLCGWGSECKIGEFGGAARGRNGQAISRGEQEVLHDQTARRFLCPARHGGSRWRDQVRHRLPGPGNRAPRQGRGLSQVRSARTHAVLLRWLAGGPDRRVRSRRTRRTGRWRRPSSIGSAIASAGHGEGS